MSTSNESSQLISLSAAAFSSVKVPRNFLFVHSLNIVYTIVCLSALQTSLGSALFSVNSDNWWHLYSPLKTIFADYFITGCKSKFNKLLLFFGVSIDFLLFNLRLFMKWYGSLIRPRSHCSTCSPMMIYLLFDFSCVF